MERDDITKYTSRFHELARSCHGMEEPEIKKLESYVGGGDTSDNKQKWNDNNNKRKWDNEQNDNTTQTPPKRQEVARAYAAGPTEMKGYNGMLPRCNKCQAHHHPGNCPRPCGKCGRVGHPTRECKAPRVARNQNPPATCFGCGKTGHFKNNCSQGRNQG